MVCRIEPATPDQIARLAEIHADALPNDFLPSLGRDFLERVYYPAALRSRYGVNLAAVSGQKTVGFACVAHESARFTTGVIREQLAAVVFYACRAVVQRPSRLRSVVEIAMSVIRPPTDRVRGEIVFIAVDPTIQGRGIGTALVTAATTYLAGHGVDRCSTKTMAANAGVIRMYERLGWTVGEQFRLIGREYVTIVSPLL